MSSFTFEDSGIDSGDKPTAEESKRAPTKHMEELEVVFRTGTGTAAAEQEVTRGAAGAVVTSQPRADESAAAQQQQQRMQPPNTCRVLQRKLELKVERARRNYSLQQQQQQHQQHHHQQQHQLLQPEEQPRKVSHAASLIPLNRLPVPGGGIATASGGCGGVEQKPLVDYKSVSSDDDEDDGEEISFFTAKLKNAHRQRKAELTDTFSIQEMTIGSELDSDDSDASQNLELLPPMMKLNLLDRVRSCFDCGASSDNDVNTTS